MERDSLLYKARRKEFIEIIRKKFKAYSPMYEFLLSVSDEYFSKEK